MFKRWGWNVACPVNLGFDGDSNGASDRRLMKWIDRYEPRLVILRCPRNVWLSQHVSEQGSSQERRRARKLKQKHYDFFKIAESVFERQVKRGDDAVLESPDQQTDQPMTQALEDTSDVEEEELLEDIPMGDSGRCTWIAYVFMTVPLKPIGEPSMYHPRVGDADSEVARRMRKITNPRVGQLVFFWRAEKKKEPSRWVGPGYVVGLQGYNAWVAVGGRCFLVAGEHLREACGDERHYGDPQIQKSIALFKRVPEEATFEDLTSQPPPTEEPTEIEAQPFSHDVSREVGDPLEGITDLPRHLAKLAGTVGWTQDELGNPVLVSYQAWAYRTPESKYEGHRLPFRSTWGRFQGEWVWLEKECKWLELENPHQFLPQAPAEVLITVFHGRTRKDLCLEDVPHFIKRHKGQDNQVNAVQFGGVMGKNKLKRMMEKEIPYEQIPQHEREIYQQAEEKEWASWRQYESCEYVYRNKNAGLVDEDTCVLIRGLQGVKQGQLLRLLKPVYGRPDAPRAWYEELAKVLVHELGFIKSQIDPAVFMLRNKDGSLIGCMVVHVDDLMVCHDGSDYAVRVIDKLGKRFPFGTWENVYEKPEGVTYCGKEIKIVKDNDGEHISLSQNAFLDGRLQEMEIAKERRKSLESLATPEEMANYRSVVGSLQWLATQSRPDLCFETNQLQKRIADLRVHDLFRANKAVREADKNRMQIMFRNLGKDAQLVVYTDAGLYSSLGVEIDERECEDVLQSDRSKRLVYSQKGAVVGFVKKGSTDVRGEFSHINVLDWRSSTNKRVIESSFCAETHAALMAIGMGHFCQVLMSELRFGSDVVGSVEDDGWNDLVPMFLVTDCKSIYDTVHKDGQHVSDKSGVIQAVLLRQLLTTRDAPGKSKLLWVPTRHQLADGLTKGARGKELREILEQGVTFREQAMKRKATGQKDSMTGVKAVELA
ncbi:RE2 [Symbiodinium microadriaticum]|nr:RE2 [Symbiodinium microadriaticum]